MLDWARDISLGTFIYTCLMFFAEFIGGVLLFSFFLRKKPRFLLRLSGSIVVMGGASALIVYLGYLLYDSVEQNNIWQSIGLGAIALTYLILTLSASIGILRFCYDSSALDAAFCGVCGYSVQHVVYRINMLFEYYVFFGTDTHWNIPLRFLTIAAVFVAVWFSFSKRLKGYTHIDMENKRVVIFYCIVLVVMILFSGVSMFYIGAPGMRKTPMVFIECGFAVVVCGLTLFALFDGITKRNVERDKRRIEWLWKADRKQYEISKSNIERLNIKYHDLKYFLKSSELAQKNNEEIERCLALYESKFVTGNETLDIVLTEKSMLFAENDISIACIADGSCLDTIEPSHLYSLFGNALDNASECLIKVDDKEKRVVDVVVKRVNGMTLVRISNYMPVAPDFSSGGLPLTTKSDNADHGFGLKSIRSIARHYGGEIRIDAKDERFVLTVLFPDISTR